MSLSVTDRLRRANLLEALASSGVVGADAKVMADRLAVVVEWDERHEPIAIDRHLTAIREQDDEAGARAIAARLGGPSDGTPSAMPIGRGRVDRDDDYQVVTITAADMVTGGRSAPVHQPRPSQPSAAGLPDLHGGARAPDLALDSVAAQAEADAFLRHYRPASRL